MRQYFLKEEKTKIAQFGFKYSEIKNENEYHRCRCIEYLNKYINV